MLSAGDLSVQKGFDDDSTMVMAEESMISAAVRHEGLPVVKSKCPADGNTNREKTKEWIRMMDKESKGL